MRLEEGGNKGCLRSQRKYVQSSQQSQGVEDARWQLCQAILTKSSESNKKWSRSSIQGWLNLMPHCPPSSELWFQLSALESCISKCSKNWPSSFIEQRLYLAASRWARMMKEENIRLEEAGKKRCLHNQRKYVQKRQQRQGVEDTSRQLCQVILTEISESNKKSRRSSIKGWLNLMPHCPPSLELWFQLSALESCISKCDKNWPSSSIEQRLYLAASRRARVKKEDSSIRLKQARGGKSKW